MEYFARLDAQVCPGTELLVIGGSAIALLGAKIRVTADIDVALPYSRIEMPDFAEASKRVGFPVDPGLGYQGPFVELIKPLMLTLPEPQEGLQIVLFTGRNLTVKTCPAAEVS